MRKFVLYICITLFQLTTVFSEAKTDEQVKNVILMIPDGTSLATVSLARWYQWYLSPENSHLNIDPYMCGTVITHCSNSPIGDSAPTTSWYMTGYPSRAGYVSTYPLPDPENDIYKMDKNKAYQPLSTILENVKWEFGKATGLVFTCEFPHATPADCAAHTYDRFNYKRIANQMVHNDVDVVIGGGVSYLNKNHIQYLNQNQTTVFSDDKNGFQNYSGNKMWALFSPKDMPFELERDSSSQPSLAEMTAKAIELLSKNENGFFLMIEGSKIDWAAHGNDPVAMVTDFLAFDEACKVALDFAKENNETAVVIVPDHGNSGISIGSAECQGQLTSYQLFDQLSKFKLTAGGFREKLNQHPLSEVDNIFMKYAGLVLTDNERNLLYNCRDYTQSPLPEEKRENTVDLYNFMIKLFKERTCIGFTSRSHTGEEVFLAVYHPENKIPVGAQTAYDLNNYLRKLSGLELDADEWTTKKFAKHTDVFKNYKYQIVQAKDDSEPELHIRPNKGKDKLIITPNTNILTKGKQEIQLNSVILYVDKTNTFYLPDDLSKYAE